MFKVTAKTRAELNRLRKLRDKTDQQIETVIRKARDEGGSLQEIGEILGLSHTQIRRILNKDKGAPP